MYVASWYMANCYMAKWYIQLSQLIQVIQTFFCNKMIFLTLYHIMGTAGASNNPIYTTFVHYEYIKFYYPVFFSIVCDVYTPK